jgi:addiction module RelE/StbE family toxin
MRILLHADFKKQYQKLRFGEKKKFKERRDLFVKDQFHPLLNNHPLQGRYKGYRSINIAGDLRAIYILIAEDAAYFIAIDMHSKLYSS